MFSKKAWFDFYVKYFLPVMIVGTTIIFGVIGALIGGIVLCYILALAGVMIGFCITMWRNNWVYKKRISIDLETYRKLPSYDYMLATFWVLDVNKYLK